MQEMTIPQYKRAFYPAVCSQTIRNWIQSGLLPARRTPTGRWLIQITDAANDSDAKLPPKANELFEFFVGGE